jgi:hypothetical protein
MCKKVYWVTISVVKKASSPEEKISFLNLMLSLKHFTRQCYVLKIP